MALIPVLVNPAVGPPPPPFVSRRSKHTTDASCADEWWPGTIEGWRWVNEASGEWTALVTYARRDGLNYHHWLPGEMLRRVDDHPTD